MASGALASQVASQAGASAASTATTPLAIAAPSLNVYKKVAVIRKSSDSLTYENDQAPGSYKSVSVEELGDAIATATPLLQPKAKLDIPVPRINLVESYHRDVAASYDVPRSYVRYQRLTPDELENTLEYVADAEDQAWLAHNVKFGGAAGSVVDSTGPDQTAAAAVRRKPQLSLSMLESMLDLLEKQTGLDSIITSHQAEDVFYQHIPVLFSLFAGKPRAGHVVAKHVIQDVYQYWVQKRSKLKRPLLRRFWPVTSLDDSNPHLVFRPREKEKYKLRRKRQNDLEAYRKLQQLRHDFDNVRAILALTVRREQLAKLHLQLQLDHFRQRRAAIVDTSGVQVPTKYVRRREAQRLQDIPQEFDVQYGGRTVKRLRSSMTGAHTLGSSGSVAGNSAATRATTTPGAASDATGVRAVGGDVDGASGIAAAASISTVIGRNNGEPAPLFLHPLYSRETYATSWEGAVPHLPTYQDSHAEPTTRFRRRIRIGRGGRVIVDRLPIPSSNASTSVPTVNVYTMGRGMLHSVEPRAHLLDLLPEPLDHQTLSRKIQDYAVHALHEDPVAARTDPEEQDGDEMVVSLDDWLETDDQPWGEERFAIGPI